MVCKLEERNEAERQYGLLFMLMLSPTGISTMYLTLRLMYKLDRHKMFNAIDAIIAHPAVDSMS